MCTGNPGFIPAANVIEFRVIFDASGQKIMNVYNVLSGAGVADADFDRIKAKLMDFLQFNWKPNSSSGCQFGLITARDLTSETGLQKEYAITPVVAGSAAGGNMPLHVTAAIKWSTGIGGRSHRGRTYHIGLVPGHVSGNQLASGTVTFLGAMYTALITKLAAGGTVDKLAIVSRCHNNVWRSTAVVTPVTSCSVDINIDSQRRRLTTRGN